MASGGRELGEGGKGSLETSLHVEGIPYITDNVETLKSKLKKHWEDKTSTDGAVKDIICPFGGTLKEAVVILKEVTNSDLDSTFNTLRVRPLPPVCSEFKATIDEFYLKCIPQKRIAELTKRVTSMLGEQCVTVNQRRNKITNVRCDWSRLKYVENAFISKGLLGREDTEQSTPVPPNIKNCLLLTGLPYLSDKKTQQKVQLYGFLREAGIKVEDLICSIQGDMTKAIAIVGSQEDVAKLVKTGSLKAQEVDEDTVKVEALPPVFNYVTATIDDFYIGHVARDTLEHLYSTMRHSCEINDKCHEISGSTDQISEAIDRILLTIGLQLRPFADTVEQSNESAPLSNSTENDEKIINSQERLESDYVIVGKNGATGQPGDKDDQKNQKTYPGIAKPVVSEIDQVDESRRNSANYNGCSNKNDSSLLVNEKEPIDSHSGNAKLAQMKTSTRHPKHDDDNEREFQSTLTASSGSSTSYQHEQQGADEFVQVHKATFEYVQMMRKSEFDAIESRYNVKIQTRTPDEDKPFDQIAHLKHQQKIGSAKEANEVDINKAKEDFINLYSGTFRSTNIIALKCDAVDQKKLKKATEMIRRQFGRVVCVTDGKHRVVFCGDEDVVKSAADEFQLAVGMSVEGCEQTFAIDEIVFQYIQECRAQQLNKVEDDFHVTIQLSGKQEVSIVPISVKTRRQHHPIGSLKEAKDEFITMYQDVFWSIKKFQVNCGDVSKERIADAVKSTQQKFGAVVFATMDNGEYLICSEESILDSVVQEFRSTTGLLHRRKLRRVDSESSEREQLPASDNSTVSKAYTSFDQHKASAASEVPCAFLTTEGLQLVTITEDLTKQEVSCIVNSSNKQLSMKLGVASALSKAAGPELTRACEAKLKERTEQGKNGYFMNEVVVTKGYDLHCDSVIHVVAPFHTKDVHNFTSNLTMTFINVLNHAEKVLKAKTIAIPLIGSGKSGGPKEICSTALATGLMNFSKNRKSHYLQQVYLVNIDPSITKAIQDKFCMMFPVGYDSLTPMIEPPSNYVQSTFAIKEGLDVVVLKSDITTFKANVVVNAANGRLKHGKGVAGALSKAAGRGLQIESDRLIENRGRALKVGEVIATDAYKLPCKKVLHAVGPRYKECKSHGEFYHALKNTYLQTLRHASESLNAQTLAIPLISSGIFGGPKDTCADALVEAVHEFSQNVQMQTTKTIYLVNIDDESTTALQTAFQQWLTEDKTPPEVGEEATEDKPRMGYTFRTKHGITLEVVRGDVAVQRVDVIVNPTDPDLRHESPFSQDLLTSAGNNLQRECADIMRQRSNDHLKLNEVVVTRGYNTMAEKILHVANPEIKPGMTPKDYFQPLFKLHVACLKHANKYKAESIAIPVAALGDIDPEIYAVAVTKALSNLVQEEKKCYIKRVALVTSNTESTVAIQMRLTDEFRPNSKVTGPATGTVTSEKYLASVFSTKEQFVIGIKYGDLYLQQTDVVVNLTDERICNAKTLSQIAGPGLQEECNDIMKTRKGGLKPGEYIATGGYNLPCENVVHAVLEDSSSDIKSNMKPADILKSTLLAVLWYAATTQRAKSVAVPIALNKGLSRSISVQILVDCIEQFSRRNSTMKTVFFVDNDESLCLEATKTFSRAFTSIDDIKEIEAIDSVTFSIYQKLEGFSNLGSNLNEDSERQATLSKGDVPAASTSSGRSGQIVHQYSMSNSSRPTSSLSSVACQWCSDLSELTSLGGCGHCFCNSCMLTQVIGHSKCPTCGSLYCEVKEREHRGTMTYFVRKDINLAGENKAGALVVKYDVPTGTQGINDPHPQTRYEGMSVTTYLPNTSEALEVAELLSKAFVDGLLFTFQPAALDPLGCEVVLRDGIPHKRSTRTNMSRDGYPDSGFTRRVKYCLSTLDV